ncbi:MULTISPECIES: NACHT domain-containing protein [unclassified Streptomyces]|uniref:NACHT domain-containing protein n=1 Tax=unclassified Streptomyces TaxID=2593676 RepID=UPI0013A6B6FF|nr:MULTISPECIES: NACHT domain-containing protein [unclassified Streptomyces]QZZ25152.1 NACHT domain-containing protein [Streptomyces sp. ST1015]
MRTSLGGPRAWRRAGLGVVGVALVALAVVLAMRDGPEETSMWLSAISGFVSVGVLALDLLRQATQAPPDEPDRRSRAADALAEAVAAQWDTRARQHRLQDPAPLAVTWVNEGPPLADHARNIRGGLPLPAPRDGERPLEPLREAFRHFPSGRLVVLGEPGSGKTVLAVEFVRDTLAVRRSDEPVPVLFALADWDPRSTGLRHWLEERLTAEYRALATVREERTLARELLDAGLILPVLDGFDELPGPVRAQALRRLNRELDERLPVLLTCRTTEWEQVTRDDVLTAAAVVRLRPLSFAAARTYLESAARPDATGRTRWTGVLDGPSAPLAEALTSPLTVALARTVYEDVSRDPGELTDLVRFPTAGHIERYLLDAFVPAAFADADPRWRPEAAHRWLRRLARDLAPADGASPGVWRFAWWELPEAMPRTLRVLGPAALALLTTAAVLVPLAKSGTGVVADWDTATSALVNFAGDFLGLCFGLAFLLPATAAATRGPRPLVRLALTVTVAASVVAVAVGVLVPPLISPRLGATITPRASWFLNGCFLGLVQCMMIAVAGLPRRPLPLGLPWAGAPSGPAAVRVLGGVLVLAGLALVGRSGAQVAAVTCLGAGLLLCLAGRRRGERTAAAYAGPAAVLRGFRQGLLRGLLACTLIGVAAAVAVGGITAAFAVMEGARITADAQLRAFEGTLRLHRDGDRWVVDCDGRPVTWHGRPVDAHNLVLALPRPVRAWLASRPTHTVLIDTLIPFVGFGLLVGTIGGCASGVYRALNTPSDTIRAVGPRSPLRTDRAAALARSAIASVLAGGVCLLLIAATGRDSTLGTMHTEVWVMMGTLTPALSAWGRTGVARLWLALTGRAPWRLMTFLEEAHHRGVLRRSGAHYEFRHLRLQQRLAADAETEETGPRDEPSLTR